MELINVKILSHAETVWLCEKIAGQQNAKSAWRKQMMEAIGRPQRRCIEHVKKDTKTRGEIWWHFLSGEYFTVR